MSSGTPPLEVRRSSARKADATRSTNRAPGSAAARAAFPTTMSNRSIGTTLSCLGPRRTHSWSCPCFPPAEYPHLPWQPLPPGKGCPTHHTKEGLNPGRSSVGEGIKEDLRLAERSNAWHAYREAATRVQTMQEAVAPDINLFFHAGKNNDLRALGFIMKGGYQGNLLDLSSRQQLPERGGPQLESLFRGGGELNITKADEKAIESSAAALQQGKGKTEDAFLGAQESDTALSSGVEKLRAAGDAVTKENANLTAAVAAIEGATAEKQAVKAQAEIEELKKQTELVKSVFEFATKWPTMIVETVEGKPAEMLGTVATILLDFVSAPELEPARGKPPSGEAKDGR